MLAMNDHGLDKEKGWNRIKGKGKEEDEEIEEWQNWSGETVLSFEKETEREQREEAG
jgi:hypothetical protein